MIDAYKENRENQYTPSVLINNYFAPTQLLISSVSKKRRKRRKGK